jgi:zinc protease
MLMIGLPSMAAWSADSYPMRVIDQLVGAPGGRIDMNLREEKGYTYGISTGFDLRKSASMFHIGGPVPTRLTKDALAEVFRELFDVADTDPPGREEVESAKEPLIQAMLDSFETTGEITERLAQMVTFDLPDSEYASYQRRIEAVSRDDVVRVAKQVIKWENATILVVGDKARIAGPLKTLPFVKSIRLIDPHGNPVPEASPKR